MYKAEMGIRAKIKIEGHPESKERLRIQSVHLICCSRSLFMVFSVMLIAVAMAVSIENPADCEGEVLFVFCRPMRS